MTPNQLPPLPEPDSYQFQHDETGQTMFVDRHQVEWGFEANNPRLHKIGGAFTADQMHAYALAALDQQAQEPVGDRYFSYSTDLGFEEYPTRDEATECANTQIKYYREDAIRDDEWPDEVDSVCWGVILGRSKEIDTSNEDHESVDYKLYTTPQPQPAPPVPEKCLTCSGHGLIGGHMPDGSGHGEPCPDCNAPPVPEPVDELIEALEDLMDWQVKNVALWHNRGYDRANRAIKKHRAALQSPAPQTKGGEA